MDYIAILQDRASPYHREALRLARQVTDSEHSSIVAGVIRWRSNGSVPPADIVALAAHLEERVDVAACDKARREEFSAFRRKAIAEDRPMSREELAEARAAHGPGAKLVNVVTGRVTVT